MITVSQYVAADGGDRFQRWLEGLNALAALRVRTALARLEAGNMSALKAVGQGVHELRIDFGPGYRVYLGNDGAEMIILLGGSTKARQDAAIVKAQAAWMEYSSASAKARRGRRSCRSPRIFEIRSKPVPTVIPFFVSGFIGKLCKH